MYFIDHLCFVCLTNNDVAVISEHDGIYKKLVYTFPEINILGEDFMYVCSSCQLMLTNFYMFKKKCVKNFYRWKSYVKKLIGNNEKETHNYADIDILVYKNTNKIVDIENEDVSCSIRERKDMDNYEGKIPKISDIRSLNSEFEDIELLFDNVDIPENKKFVNELETYSNEKYVCDDTQDLKCTEILLNNNFENKVVKNHLENKIVNNDEKNKIDNNVFDNNEIANETIKDTIENNLCLENSENDFIEKIPYNKRKHTSKKLQEKHGPKPKINSNQELGKDFLCDLCGSFYETAEKLKNHRYYKHPQPKIFCEYCRRNIRSENMSDHIKFHKNKPYECIVCHEKFRLNKDFLVHKKVHGVKEFRCAICDRDFLVKGTLERHIKSHKGIKDHECTICGKRFVQKNYLNIHTRIHMGIRNSKCDICGASFFTKKYLNIHMESHSPTEIECHICKKKFQSKFYFKIHMNMHKGIKDHECPICHKTYTARNNLKLHLQKHSNHTEYSCQMCGKLFVNVNTFEHHMFKHSEEDKLVCKFCGKHFYKKSTFDLHMKKHNE